jgi:hypothetical protein
MEASMHRISVLAVALALAGACYPYSRDSDAEPGDSDAPDTDPGDTDGQVEPLDCATVGFFGDQPDFDDAGTLVGRLTSPSGEIPVAGGRVSVTVGGQEAWVASVEEGCFHLDLPPGTHSVTVSKGRYGASAEVVIEAGARKDIGAVALDDGGVRIAVVYGQWDDAGELIGDLGIPTEGYLSPHELLGDAALLAEYDVLFANCGSDVSTSADDGYTAAEIANVKAWVEAGGTLYVSDWEYELFQGVASDAAFFEDDPHTGTIGTVTGTLLDRDLIALLGKDTVEIRYDLPYWVVIRDVGATGLPLVVGRVDGDDRPLALLTHPGAGRAVFTTFHNEEQLGEDLLAVLYQMILLL